VNIVPSVTFALEELGQFTPDDIIQPSHVMSFPYLIICISPSYLRRAFLIRHIESGLNSLVLWLTFCCLGNGSTGVSYKLLQGSHEQTADCL